MLGPMEETVYHVIAAVARLPPESSMLQWCRFYSDEPGLFPWFLELVPEFHMCEVPDAG